MADAESIWIAFPPSCRLCGHEFEHGAMSNALARVSHGRMHVRRGEAVERYTYRGYGNDKGRTEFFEASQS